MQSDGNCDDARHYLPMFSVILYNGSLFVIGHRFCFVLLQCYAIATVFQLYLIWNEEEKAWAYTFTYSMDL